MPIIYIPVGIPGCGKSHLMRGLHPHAIVSSDQIREILTGDMNDQTRNGDVFKQFHENIELWLRGGKTVAADATNLDRDARGTLRRIVADVNRVGIGGYVATHVILFRNLSQAIVRNAARERTVPPDAMLRMIEKYERAVIDIASENYDYVTEVSSVR
jgi:predicted kinase